MAFHLGEKGPDQFVGIPFDGGTHDRRGQHDGPEAVRQVGGGDWWDPMEGCPIQPISDLGDAPVNRRWDPQQMHDTVLEWLGEREFMRLAMVGGDHSVSAPAVTTMADRYGGMLDLIVFDSHADDQNDGDPLDHGNWIRFARFREYDIIRPQDLVPCPRYSSSVPLYVSIDLDCISLSDAPAVGTPTWGGWSALQMMSELDHLLRTRNVVAIDVVELVPKYDVDERTARLAMTLIGQVFRRWQAGQY